MPQETRTTVYKAVEKAEVITSSEKAWNLKVLFYADADDFTPHIENIWLPKSQVMIKGSIIWAAEWVIKKKEKEMAERRGWKLATMGLEVGLTDTVEVPSQ
jgi:hypothetical protein